jgi:hypothetical protein
MRALDSLVHAQESPLHGVPGKARSSVCIGLPALTSVFDQQAFRDASVPENWKALPSTSNASESIGADIKKSCKSMRSLL